MINNDILRYLMNQVNKSFYVYDEEEILKSINILKDKFSEFEFLYSVKANHNKHILDLMRKNNMGVDAASAKEVKLSALAQIDKEKIIYSSPGKTIQDIKSVIDECIIVIMS